MSAGNVIVLKRILSASRERVFEAWTKEEIVKQWFCPDKGMSVPVAELDVREGGHYHVVMQNENGETYSPSGTYEKIVPNEQLIFSWKWADSELITRVTIDFRKLSDTETELTLTHDGFPEKSIGDRHYEGWEGCLSRLSGLFT